MTHGVAGGTWVVSRWGSLGTRGVTGVCPGKHTRDTCRTRGFRGISFARLAAYSEASGRVLLAWVLGTHGLLAWHPEGSLGLGTRGHVVLSQVSREYSLGR